MGSVFVCPPLGGHAVADALREPGWLPNTQSFLHPGLQTVMANHDCPPCVARHAHSAHTNRAPCACVAFLLRLNELAEPAATSCPRRNTPPSRPSRSRCRGSVVTHNCATELAEPVEMPCLRCNTPLRHRAGRAGHDKSCLRCSSAASKQLRLGVEQCY